VEIEDFDLTLTHNYDELILEVNVEKSKIDGNIGVYELELNSPDVILVAGELFFSE